MRDIQGQNIKTLIKTKKLILVIMISVVLCGLFYLFTGSAAGAMILIGLVVVVLSMYHPLCSIMLLLFVFPFEGAIQLSQVGMFSRIIGILVVTSYLIHNFRFNNIIPKILIPVLIFYGFAVCSCLWAFNLNAAVEGGIALTLNVVCLLILVNSIRSEDDLRYLMLAVFIGACVSAFLIIIGNTVFTGGGTKMSRTALLEGTNPNVLGNSILLGFLSGFYLFNQKDRLMQFLFVAAVPLLLIAILKTQNRTALGILVMAPIVGFVISSTKKNFFNNIVKSFFVIILAAGIVFTILQTDLLTKDARQRMRDSRYDLERSGRTTQWRNSLELLAHRPFVGWGYKNFPLVSDFHMLISSAHSNYFSIAAELGTIGLLSWFSIYVVLFKRLFKMNHPPLKWLMCNMLMFNMIVGITSTSIIRKGYWYSLGFAILASSISTVKNNYKIVLKNSDNNQ